MMSGWGPASYPSFREVATVEVVFCEERMEQGVAVQQTKTKTDAKAVACQGPVDLDK